MLIYLNISYIYHFLATVDQLAMLLALILQKFIQLVN